MAPARRILILSARVGSGHGTAAVALERAFRRIPDATVCHADAMDFSTYLHHITYSGLYFPMARVAPWLMEWGYQLHHRPFATEPVLQLWDRLNTLRLARFICEYRPDTVVCTHFMPANLVGHLIERGRLSASLSIVLTDYDFHGIWLCRTFSRYCVALEEARAHCSALGLPEQRVIVSGIPVDPLFEQPVDRAAVLARYGLRPDVPVILVSAGTSGNSSIRQVVEQLMLVRDDLQVLVVCGRNDALRRAIELLVAGQPERFRVLGFSEQMPDLMRIATLFIGKPGGLTAAECMAAGLPMLIIEPLPGQEDRNSNHLLEAGAAIRANNRTIIAYKVERLLAEPERLAQMRTQARSFGRPEAARVLAETLLAEPLPPIQLDRRQRRQIADLAAGRARQALRSCLKRGV